MPHKDTNSLPNGTHGTSDSSVNRLATTGNTLGASAFGTGMDQNSGMIPEYLSTGSEDLRPLSKEEADRLYEERMEEEYAKREGGA